MAPAWSANWSAFRPLRDPTPTLLGEGIVIRAPRRSDFAAWAEVRRASRDHLVPFEPSWTLSDLTPAIFAARLRRARREARAGTDFLFLIFARDDSHALLGGITLSNVRRRAAQTGTLGYWMRADRTGQGIMTHAVGLVADHAFGPMGLNRLEAACLPHNQASRRVLEKNGFAEEGFAPEYLNLNGAWRDHVLYGLPVARYRAGKAGH